MTSYTDGFYYLLAPGPGAYTVRLTNAGQAAEQRLSPLLVIVPRDQVARYQSFAGEFEGIAGCRVILDRRVAERRRVPPTWDADERRRGERRSGQLESSQGLVVFVR